MLVGHEQHLLEMTNTRIEQKGTKCFYVSTQIWHLEHKAPNDVKSLLSLSLSFSFDPIHTETWNFGNSLFFFFSLLHRMKSFSFDSTQIVMDPLKPSCQITFCNAASVFSKKKLLNCFYQKWSTVQFCYYVNYKKNLKLVIFQSLDYLI